MLINCHHVQPMPGDTISILQVISDVGPFSLSFEAYVAKLFAKPQCSALPVKPQQAWSVCTAAGNADVQGV